LSEHIHLEKFQQGNKQDRRYLVWDLFMILLLFSNLSWLIFDAFMTANWLQGTWQSFIPQFHSAYLTYVTPNFYYIDGVFVAFFLGEFCVRWAISLKNKEYPGWFFFPLFHWYDLLGSIPLAELRWLRVFRVVSILLRLHRMEVINLKDNFFYHRFVKYHDILVEEVSDKVVLNVLDGVQAEFNKNDPLGRRILEKVIQPNQEELVRWISASIEDFITDHYQKNRQVIEDDIRRRVELAVEHQSELQVLEKVPVVGDKISQEIQRVVSNVVWQVTDGLIQDIATDGSQPDMDVILGAVATNLSQENPRLHALIKKMSLETIEQVKAQVAIKNWRRI
jgi:predicted DNA-binding protein YlxM (UPF0122 family)